MDSVAALAFARQRRLVAVADTARTRALHAWRGMDFANLDASWASIAPSITQQVSNAQFTLASGADNFTSAVSRSYPFKAADAKTVPQAFVGVDGDGRELSGTLLGAVTTTKQAIGAGLGEVRSLEAGANYLGAILKTIIGDLSRSADLVSSAAKGYTHYIRVVGGSACSRCGMLAGIASGEQAFQRHVSCQCSAAPVFSTGKLQAPAGMYSSPEEYFDSLSKEEQDRAFTKDGAEAIRSGADISKVVSARRGAKGIGYSSAIGGGRQVGDPRGVFVKTTIGIRPNGQAVQVYTTTEGTTARGQFGKANIRTSETRKAASARYTSTARVRLMPESIMQIAGTDLKLRQAFLRDAGYIEYRQPVFNAKTHFQDIEAQRHADRIAVDRATAKFGNFYLG